MRRRVREQQKEVHIHLPASLLLSLNFPIAVFINDGVILTTTQQRVRHQQKQHRKKEANERWQKMAEIANVFLHHYARCFLP